MADRGVVRYAAFGTHGDGAAGQGSGIGKAADAAVAHGESGTVLAGGDGDGTAICHIHDAAAGVHADVEGGVSGDCAAIHGQGAHATHLAVAHVEHVDVQLSALVDDKLTIVGHRCPGVIPHTADVDIIPLVVSAAIQLHNGSALVGADGEGAGLVLVPDVVPLVGGQCPGAGEIGIQTIVLGGQVSLCGMQRYHGHGSNERAAQCEIQMEFHNVDGKWKIKIQRYQSYGTTSKNNGLVKLCKAKSTEYAVINAGMGLFL